MKRILFLLFLLSLPFSVTPARAQTAPPQPVARAVLFTSPICTFCREIVEGELPPAIENFGERLEILFVDTTTAEGQALYESALAASGQPRGIPHLFIGQTALMGVNIPKQLPALVESSLAQGGSNWPAIPGLDDYLASRPIASVSTAASVANTETPQPEPTGTGPVVRARMYSMEGCPHCDEVKRDVLPPLYARYGGQFDLQIVEIVTLEDVNHLYQVAAGYGISKERAGVPLLIIGEKPLVGADEIRGQLPALIEEYLARGGVEVPAALPEGSSGGTAPVERRNNGFALAMVVMALMAAALVYSALAFVTGKMFSLPPWADWLTPFIILVGIGVAGYLAYVETQQVAAVCGPVGDCNAVQSSPYATLFGFLPVGVLGLLGYFGLLAAWLARKFIPGVGKLAAMAFLGMSFFALIFSLYLTYLELFVIEAVCAWCLASAVLVTLLLLLGLPPAVRFRRG